MRRPHTLQGRLTLLFGFATLVLSALVGVTVYLQFRTQLRDALDADLRSRFAGLEQQLAVAQAAPASRPAVPLLPEAESFAQVVTRGGSVIEAEPKALLRRPVLSAGERAAASRGRVTFERAVPPDAERARLLAGPDTLSHQPVVIVVGSSLEAVNKAEHRLALALELGLPLLAALVTLGGWFLAGAALAPVRSLIEEADDLSEREPGRRLSIPDGGDELAELARGLNELLSRIEAAVAHERAFLDDASHELRTPIAIVRGEVELARMNAVDAGTTRALDSVMEEIERLDHLATNLLVLARARGRGAHERHPLELEVLAQRAVDDVARAHPELVVEMSVSGHSRATGDGTALERAIGNLVENAVRHARGRVDVVLGHDEAGYAVIDVRDDGPGFPAPVLAHAFDRFSRGAAPPGEGAGLGLAIVDAIAAAHRGDVAAENPPGGGALVRIRLPADHRSTSTGGGVSAT